MDRNVVELDCDVAADYSDLRCLTDVSVLCLSVCR